MIDPLRSLLLELETDLKELPGATLTRVAATDDAPARFTRVFGRKPSAGFAALLSVYDGGLLAPNVRLFSVAESEQRLAQEDRSGDLKGLWPILDREGRLFALDAEAATTDEAEWPVVEVADRSVDRAGTTVLRFLHALTAELAAGEASDSVLLARELCRRDPGLAAHWVWLADELERAGRVEDMDSVLAVGLLSSNPAGPALVLARALRALDHENEEAAGAALEDAMSLEPLTARDDDARLDAAAVTLALAERHGDVAAAVRSREILGPASASTGSYWRGEAFRAVVDGLAPRATLAAQIVASLIPEDTDVGKLKIGDERLVQALKALSEARDALDRAAMEEAMQKARAAVTQRPDLGICHAMLAEALNARRDRGALDAARRATELNPALVEAWRELGDAYLEARQAPKAEESYRHALSRDPTYGLGHAKLAQALLEQGRTLEALDAITAAQERGGDAFFIAAVRGDILAEMSRHREAAEAYEQALRVEPEDHWILHQAALEHGRDGNDGRAVELFERALQHDREGCHQTLVDYGDLLRRVGRIGDAVRLYRKAVMANPGDTEWRQVLREAERELHSAPN